MRVIAKRRPREFWELASRRDAEEPLRAWYRIAVDAEWHHPANIKRQFQHASIVGSNRVVFNIAGNKYRLVALNNYPYGVLYIRFLGTHQEYDGIDVRSV